MPRPKSHGPLSMDRQLDESNRSFLRQIREYADFQRYHLLRYAEIGMALSGEEDRERLLEMIVTEAREISDADAGSLYMVNSEGTHLNFVIMQNDTMDTFLGGVHGEKIDLPPVPLFVEGEKNHSHVSAHVAHSGEIVNIPDVYECEAFDFSGSHKYDQKTGYRSKSMLVIPLRNHEQDVIGVLQLLNAMEEEGSEAVEFVDEHVGLVASLASQAAVTLTKSKLIRNLTELFDAFTKSIATAIEEKSRFTGGHIMRVSKLTLMLAKKISEQNLGVFQDVHFSKHELEELRIAAWLHDVGKIITPEHVMDKSSKLELITDAIQIVEARFAYIGKAMEADYFRNRLQLYEQENHNHDELTAQYNQKKEELEQDKAFVISCNSPSEYVDDNKIERLYAIAQKTFIKDHKEHPYLTEQELENLSIRKGTLTDKERGIMENHAKVTYNMLTKLPFPKNMAKVADYASQHHEKLDGSGYPFGLKGDELSLQTRIMAVADIFEALTARDRPYKQPMGLSQAISILGSMGEQGHLDQDVSRLLVETDVLATYALEELNPDQIDISLESTRENLSDEIQYQLENILKQPPTRKTADTTTPPTILIVDDSKNSTMLLQYYLRDHYPTHFAANGLEGLEKFTKEKYGAVLLDLEMPVLNGYTTAKNIRLWEDANNLPHVPLLSICTHILKSAEKTKQHAYFTDHISRPLNKEKILSKILRTLNKHKK